MYFTNIVLRSIIFIIFLVTVEKCPNLFLSHVVLSHAQYDGWLHYYNSLVFSLPLFSGVELVPQRCRFPFRVLAFYHISKIYLILSFYSLLCLLVTILAHYLPTFNMCWYRGSSYDGALSSGISVNCASQMGVRTVRERQHVCAGLLVAVQGRICGWVWWVEFNLTARYPTVYATHLSLVALLTRTAAVVSTRVYIITAIYRRDLQRKKRDSVSGAGTKAADINGH